MSDVWGQWPSGRSITITGQASQRYISQDWDNLFVNVRKCNGDNEQCPCCEGSDTRVTNLIVNGKRIVSDKLTRARVLFPFQEVYLKD